MMQYCKIIQTKHVVHLNSTLAKNSRVGLLNGPEFSMGPSEKLNSIFSPKKGTVLSLIKSHPKSKEITLLSIMVKDSDDH